LCDSSISPRVDERIVADSCLKSYYAAVTGRFLKNSEIRKRTISRMRETGETFMIARSAVIAAWQAENPPKPQKRREYPFSERDGLPKSRHLLSGFETKRSKH